MEIKDVGIAWINKQGIIVKIPLIRAIIGKKQKQTTPKQLSPILIIFNCI